MEETEENARQEDEAYIQAKREAARVAKQSLNQQQQQQKKTTLASKKEEFASWLSDEGNDEVYNICS